MTKQDHDALPFYKEVKFEVQYRKKVGENHSLIFNLEDILNLIQNKKNIKTKLYFYVAI